MYNFPLSVGVYFSLLVGPGGPKDDDDDDHGFLCRHGQSIIRARFTWTEPQKKTNRGVLFLRLVAILKGSDVRTEQQTVQMDGRKSM